MTYRTALKWRYICMVVAPLLVITAIFVKFYSPSIGVLIYGLGCIMVGSGFGVRVMMNNCDEELAEDLANAQDDLRRVRKYSAAQNAIRAAIFSHLHEYFSRNRRISPATLMRIDNWSRDMTLKAATEPFEPVDLVCTLHKED